MAFKLYVPASVREEIRKILIYISENQSKERSRKVKESLRAALLSIKSNPYAFELEIHGFIPEAEVRRRIVHHTYRIIYSIDGQKITVLSIHHNSRKPRSFES